MALDILRIIVGLVILIVAADRLVVSAVRVAKVLNISVVVIGAVIVGFGTSIPEFVVSAIAATEGQTGLAMSNIVASNTANVTLVPGVAAVITVLATRRSAIKRTGLLMLASVVLVGVVLADGQVSTIEGVLLLVALAGATGLLMFLSGDDAQSSDDSHEEIGPSRDRVWIEILFGVGALVATVLAGQQLLTGVISIGETLGLSVVFMGLITGVGTSLPELSAAIAGARRGAADLVVGNIIGSNVVNSLGVAGLAAILGPGSIDGVPIALLGLMLVAVVLAGVFSYTSERISRLEGAALLGVFSLYAYLSL